MSVWIKRNNENKIKNDEKYNNEKTLQERYKKRSHHSFKTNTPTHTLTHTKRRKRADEWDLWSNFLINTHTIAQFIRARTHTHNSHQRQLSHQHHSISMQLEWFHSKWKIRRKFRWFSTVNSYTRVRCDISPKSSNFNSII